MMNSRHFNQIMGVQNQILSRAACSGNTPVKHSVSRHEKSVQVSMKVPDDFQRLSNDFSRLLNEEINADWTLSCGGRTWRVHRSVMAIRSEVFAAMFMDEIETRFVHVEDLEAPVMDSLLKYIYSGKIPDLSGENVSSLYEAGEKYALFGLRKACSDWMVGNLSDDNCLNVLVVADALGNAELKKAAATFICEHPALFKCATWNYFVKECPTLGVEVLQQYALSGKKGASDADCLFLE